MKTLSDIEKYKKVKVVSIDESLLPKNIELDNGELERRLLEIGIMENTILEILHFGAVNKDPIAVRINNNEMTIAIRRNEAQTIIVEE
ncbi:MAG: FeoA family protein [Burkholderiales bacterium]|nr:FeoA family protein [Burkholderiales bacterium]